MTRKLLAWFDQARRDLPWRRSTSFYPVWLSEIMLQQTRVETVIPYYERFLARFPSVEALAQAQETDVLALWSGLGYYSRARNLHKAAQRIAAEGTPASYKAVRALPGVGPYTAAAIASISLGEPHAAVDGNVVRVVSRLTNGAPDIEAAAQALLDRRRPGDFNQAMMELGALICVPLHPRCAVCPVAEDCAARAAGTERDLPVKIRKSPARRMTLDLALFEKDGSVFLIQRSTGERRMAGFWELPEKKLFPRWRGVLHAGFTHQIVNDRFAVAVWKAAPPKTLPDGRWFDRSVLSATPITTISRKAITLQ